MCVAALCQGDSGLNNCIKSSDPINCRPSTIAKGGSGANHANGIASSDNGFGVWVGTTGSEGVSEGVDDGDERVGSGVKVDRTGCTLHEESSNAKMRTGSIIFIAASFFKQFSSPWLLRLLCRWQLAGIGSNPIRHGLWTELQNPANRPLAT